MRQWLQNLFARKTSRPRRHSRFRPTLEPLGERLAPATFNVANLNDSGTGSLRKAIADANARVGADDITFQAGLTGTITLTSGQLEVTGGLTIHGPGAQVLTVSGNDASRIFDITDNHPGQFRVVTISGLTLTGGLAAVTMNEAATGFGGAIRNFENLTLAHCTLADNSARDGGGLYNGGTATLSHCTLSGNSDSRYGGGLYNGGMATLTDCTLVGNSAFLGGGLYNSGTGTLANCTLSGNSASRAGGGGYFPSGIANLRNCTLVGNSAPDGGGLFLEATTTLSNCTLSGNSATRGGGLFIIGTATLSNCTLSNNSADTGGGLINGSVATMNNTIVANSPSGGDFRTLGIHSTLSGSHNLIEDGSGGLADTVSGDPHLGPLQDNGGPTWTHALLAGSPARDAGSDALAVGPTGTPLAFDQRGPGFTRLVGDAVDVGAFEWTQPPPAPSAPSPTPTPEPRVTFRLVRRRRQALLHTINEQTGETRFVRLAFGARATKGRLRSVADFNGDGVLDALVTARVGGVVRRKVFSGANGAQLR